jgi:hypothetical protein
MSFIFDIFNLIINQSCNSVWIKDPPMVYYSILDNELRIDMIAQILFVIHDIEPILYH